MKVIAFNGSPRKNGNTSLLIEEVFKPLKEAGIDTEMIHLKGKKMSGCVACGKCKKGDKIKCHKSNDFINGCIDKMMEADAIILGSPVYFSDVTPEMKMLIDVAGYVTKAQGSKLKRKVGAAVIAVRRGGAVHTFETMNNLFLISEMIVPGSTYWNFGIGRNPGDVLEDEEGMANMKNLGENMAWLLQKLNS